MQEDLVLEEPRILHLDPKTGRRMLSSKGSQEEDLISYSTEPLKLLFIPATEMKLGLPPLKWAARTERHLRNKWLHLPDCCSRP